MPAQAFQTHLKSMYGRGEVRKTTVAPELEQASPAITKQVAARHTSSVDCCTQIVMRRNPTGLTRLSLPVVHHGTEWNLETAIHMTRGSRSMLSRNHVKEHKIRLESSPKEELERRGYPM